VNHSYEPKIVLGELNWIGRALEKFQTCGRANTCSVLAGKLFAIWLDGVSYNGRPLK